MFKWLSGPLHTSGLLLLVYLFSATSCNYAGKPIVIDSGKPKRTLKEFFDKKYLLYKLPDNFYQKEKLNQTFNDIPANFLSDFKPLGYDKNLNLQYTHVYSPQCVYHKSDSIWKYAEVCFPNTCLTRDDAHASVKVHNSSNTNRTFYLRLFYQNTTYWYRTDDSIDLNNNGYLDNYYGASPTIEVTLSPNGDSIVSIPFSVGVNPKHEFDGQDWKDPARAGNYEFMVLALPDKKDALLNENLDLKKNNPFATVKMDEVQNGGKKYFHSIAYVGSHHFKFVFLDEYFDGVNDLGDNHIYIAKNGKEKKLCDTCTGWYRAVINEYWKSADFFKGGYLNNGYLVKADYGIKKENYHIDTNGITLTIPKSTRGNYKKTWAEFIFGPSFKYGHLTVKAKFAQMMNKTGTPNGIIHNLWLYERDPEPVDSTKPYSKLKNDAGLQPYEIDFEIWNSQENINTMWDENAFINYSIVDYMRNPDVLIKPGEVKKFGKYPVNRLNNRQVNIPGENIPKQFFDSFHLFELYWYPDKVRFLVDGYEHAVITKDMAKIPDKYAFLWIGSPLYQDGTYYAQSLIPFLKADKQTIIDYIRIE